MDSPNTPQQALEVLRTVEFKLGLKGYNVDEVDEFLERAAVEAEHLRNSFASNNSSCVKQPNESTNSTVIVVAHQVKRRRWRVRLLHHCPVTLVSALRR
jgi:DivIVA domain-containing protein